MNDLLSNAFYLLKYNETLILVSIEQMFTATLRSLRYLPYSVG